MCTLPQSKCFLQVREPDGDLALGGLWGVGTVNHVGGHLKSEVAADGTWGCLGNWVGATSKLAPCLDSAWALNNASDQWCGGDEVHQLTEEWLVSVLCIVFLSSLAVCNAQVKSGEFQAFALDAGDDFTDEAALNAVWLDQNQGTFSHGWIV